MNSYQIVLTLICSVVVLLCGCKPKEIAQEEAVNLKLNQVTVGMTRAQVYKILPKVRDGYSVYTGGAQCNTYWINKHWKVSILFDYTGITRDESGMATEHENLNDKVVNLPELIREDMPEPITMNWNETSNKKHQTNP